MEPSFALKKGLKTGKCPGVRGTKIMAMTDCHSLPLGLTIEDASCHEVQLVDSTIWSRYLRDLPERIVGDKTYDSDRLRDELRRDSGIELMSPHQLNQKKEPTQEGRALRRYRRRWCVERFFAGFKSFKRIQVRYEKEASLDLGFVQLEAIMIISRFL